MTDSHHLLVDSIGKRLSNPMPRCICIGVITLCLLVPLGLVKGIIHERMHLYKEATGNIIGSWGWKQAINGPALIIPYQIWQDRKDLVTEKVNGKEEKKEIVTREYLTRHKVILPSELVFDVLMDTEIRYRGIYKHALYTAPMTISGSFLLPTEKDFASNTTQIAWDKAWFCVGVSDLKTIVETTPLRWAETSLAAYKPGTRAGELLGPGFHTEIPLMKRDVGTKHAFSLKLALRGSEGISFTPVGENTAITLKSAWPAPSFQGNLLPIERSVTDQGFTARWAISNLTRTYPQIGDLEGREYMDKKNDASSITLFTAGVNLHEPVTLYRMVRRSVDYGILFIAVTFVALFAFELISRQRMHMVQYAMVGLSMSLFYMVLLSLAEHINFGLAFVAASAATVVMNSAYMAAVLQNRAKGLLLGVLLSILYAVLFSLLRMEDFALLMGTGVVLVMMGALMFVTRKLPRSVVQAEALP